MAIHNGMSVRKALKEAKEHAQYENFYAFLSGQRGSISKEAAIGGGALILLGISAYIYMNREGYDDTDSQTVPGQKGPSVTIAPTDSPTGNIIATPSATPEQVYDTIKPTETPHVTQTPQENPVEKYANAEMGGTFESGDAIFYLGVNGEISSGKIEDGKITSMWLVLRDENNEIVFDYTNFPNYPSLGHVELISYPQPDNPECSEPCVLLKVNGVDSGYRMRYGDTFEATLETYKVWQEEGITPEMAAKLTGLS